MRLRFALLLTLMLGITAGCSHDSDPAPVAWKLLPYGAPQLSGFSAVRFASAQVGWIIGGYVPDQLNSSTLLTTRDGGATWARVNMLPFTFSGFRALSPVSEQVVFAVGVDPAAVSPTLPGPVGPANGRAVYKSTDGGTTWQKLPGTGFADSFQLHFFDEQNGLSFKNQTIQRTTDGGTSWQTVFVPASGNWDRVQFPTPAVGYAAGGGISGGFVVGLLLSTGSLAKTTDRGATWQALPWTHQYISSLSFVSATVGFAATYPDHHLYKTQDGGTTWALVNSQLPASGNGQFLNEQEGYFADGQSIQRTTDGGLTWHEEFHTTPNSQYPATINSLHFPTAAAGFAVTADGQIIRGTR
ncbi:WD40/YVTN/BNR-like repeat-containing protein [Hymenobacter sedentarius]|nr:hypothetical protein [Hymenobacter sedentarius]